MKTIALNDSWLFRKLPGCALDSAAEVSPEAFPGETVNLPHTWYRDDDQYRAEVSPEAFPGETVNLPHTWYRDDDQYRGLCVYEKEVPSPEGERLFLSFDAADQRCAVYCNGLLCGTHRGGYARFRLPVPAEAVAGTLRIRVFTDNSLDEDICPSFGDFTVFGGLYRGAALLVCGRDHFDRCYFGTDGLILRASLDEQGDGILSSSSRIPSAHPGRGSAIPSAMRKNSPSAAARLQRTRRSA